MNSRCSRKLIIDALAGDLSPQQESELAGHLEVCEKCRLVYENVRDDYERMLSEFTVADHATGLVPGLDVDAGWKRVNRSLEKNRMPTAALAMAASLLLIIGAAVIFFAVRGADEEKALDSDQSVELADKVEKTHPSVETSGKSQEGFGIESMTGKAWKLSQSDPAQKEPLSRSAVIGAGDSILTGAGSTAGITLASGIKISIGSDSRIRAGRISGHAQMHLLSGRARFEIDPSASQKGFSVTAGRYTVSVTGTIFTVEMDSEELKVSVQRGSVVVRGPDQLMESISSGHTRSWIRTDTVAADDAESPGLDASRKNNRLHRRSAPARSPMKMAAKANREGRYSDAVAFYLKEVQRGGPEAEVALLRAAEWTYEKLKDRNRGIVLYEKFIARHPRGPFTEEARGSLCTGLARAGRKDRAMDVCGTYLRQHASGYHRPAVALIMADYLSSASACSKAIPMYEEFLRKGGNTGRASALVGLAKCQIATGRRDEAARTLKAYLRDYPNGKDAESVRETLKSLK